MDWYKRHQLLQPTDIRGIGNHWDHFRTFRYRRLWCRQSGRRHDYRRLRGRENGKEDVSSHWRVGAGVHDALDWRIQCNPSPDNDRPRKLRFHRRHLSLRRLLLCRIRTRPVDRRWRSCTQPRSDGGHVTCHWGKLAVLVYDFTRDAQHARGAHIRDVFAVRDVLHAHVGMGILLFARDKGVCVGRYSVPV